MKICNTCRAEKSFEDFSVSRANKDGRQNKCKECSSAYRRQLAKDNPEKALAGSYRQTEKLLERNPNYFREFYAKQYATEAGRQRMITNVQNRRARLMEAEGSYTAQEFIDLCDKYGNICLACEESKPLTVDHIIPLSLGGSNTIDNIQPLCRSCNSRKRVTSIDFREKFALEI